MPIARRKCSFVNEGSKLPVLAILVASPKSMLGRRSPNCRDDPVWERAQWKAGTQGTRGNSSAASAIVEWRGGRATYAKFPSILACTQETVIFLAQPVLFHPAGDRLHWGQKKVALFQLPFLLLLKPYTAMTAHTSPQVPIRSQLCGLCLLKRQVSPMGVWVGCCIFSSVRFVQGPLRTRVSLETHCSDSAE